MWAHLWVPKVLCIWTAKFADEWPRCLFVVFACWCGSGRSPSTWGWAACAFSCFGSHVATSKSFARGACPWRVPQFSSFSFWVRSSSQSWRTSFSSKWLLPDCCCLPFLTVKKTNLENHRCRVHLRCLKWWGPSWITRFLCWLILGTLDALQPYPPN